MPLIGGRREVSWRGLYSCRKCCANFDYIKQTQKAVAFLLEQRNHLLCKEWCSSACKDLTDDAIQNQV